MIDPTSWAWAMVVAGVGLQILGRAAELRRTPVDPTARPVPPDAPPVAAPTFLLMELPGQLMVFGGLWLLRAPLGWTGMLAVFLLCTVTTGWAAVFLRDGAAREVMRPVAPIRVSR